MNELADLASDVLGFVLFVFGFVDADGLSPTLGGFEFEDGMVFAVGADDGVGGVEDGLGGAVVLGELKHMGVGVVGFEVENVFDGGAAEGIDGLGHVADDTEIVMTLG